MALSPYEIANVFADLAAATASNPTQLNAAGAVKESAQGGLRSEYEEKKKEAEKKAKKSGLLHGIANIASSIIPGPFDDIALDVAASEFAGDEGSFLDHTINAAAPHVIGYAAGKGGDFLANKLAASENGVLEPGSFKANLANYLSGDQFGSDLTNIAQQFLPKSGPSTPSLPMGLTNQTISAIRGDERAAEEMDFRKQQEAFDQTMSLENLDLSKAAGTRADRQVDIQEEGLGIDKAREGRAAEEATYDISQRPKKEKLTEADIRALELRNKRDAVDIELQRLEMENYLTPQQQQDMEVATSNAMYEGRNKIEQGNAPKEVLEIQHGENGDIIYYKDGSNTFKPYAQGFKPRLTGQGSAPGGVGDVEIRDFRRLMSEAAEDPMKAAVVAQKFSSFPPTDQAILEQQIPYITQFITQYDQSLMDIGNGGEAAPGTPQNPLKPTIVNGVPVITPPPTKKE